MRIRVERKGFEGFKARSHFRRTIQKPLVIAMGRILDIGVKSAKVVYADQRKSTNPRSFIIDSFAFEIPFHSDTLVEGVMFAGGPQAPWAIYVDQPRKGFDGYFFMKAGREAMEEVAPKIIREELRNRKN